MHQLVKNTHERLAAIADPRRAPDMQRYMKSAMPFLGVPTPTRRAVTNKLWKEFTPQNAADWRAQVAALWDSATHREERYAAVDWCRYAWASDRRLGRERFAFHTLEALPLFERLIVEGSWWDLVDELAAHQLGVLMMKYPTEMKLTLRSWACGDHLWKRRSAILSQLDFKEKTDTQFLCDCFEPSLPPSPFAREFFIQKGMGWALRQYARVDAAWVRDYVRKNEARLSSLTRREASKHL